MPRQIPVHWDGEPAVLQREAEDVWEQLQPLGKLNDNVLDQVIGSADHKAELIDICQKHLTWRDQETSSMKTGAGNEQLRRIAAEARALGLSQEVSKESVIRLQYKIAGLVSGPEYRLYHHLTVNGLSLESFTAIDVTGADWLFFAEACEVITHPPCEP